MRGLTGIMALSLAAAPAAALAQYEQPANPPDPAAHLAEMVALYDQVCLQAFPDDGAVRRNMAERGAAAMTAAEVEILLHDDPGFGWHVDGNTARFEVTIEAPPFHSCGVRTTTAHGFADLGPYRAVADRFEEGKGFQRFNPMTMNIGTLATTGGGEQRATREGGESLLVFLTTPAEGHRDHGQTAVEVRFVHQFSRR